MSGFEVRVGSCEPVVIDYSRTLSKVAADAFSALLPFSTMIRQAEWCGQAAVASVPGSPILEPVGASARAASLYPGWLVWDPSRGLLLASYGKAEYRSATGVQYGYVLGQAMGDHQAFMAALASLHSDGQVAMTCRQANGAVAAQPNPRPRFVLRGGEDSFTFEPLAEMAPKSVDQFAAQLPVEIELTTARWSGNVLHGALPASLTFDTRVLEHPAASLYPGTMAIAPVGDGSWELLVSYGRTELRDAEGMAYATPIAQTSLPASELGKWLEQTPPISLTVGIESSRQGD
ncbi:MAG: hypothetical protein ACRDRJ_02535 [Streptosporangiaceae bacterium]